MNTGLRFLGRALLTSLVALSPVFWPRAASATNGLESPDNGVVQSGRGGAWLARADDPLAFFFNPAALVTQAHGVHIGFNLMFRSHCFDRLDETGARPSPGQNLLPAPDEVCADVLPIPNPQIAASIRLHRMVALGFGVVAPHNVGPVEWPEVLTYTNRFGIDADHPSPSRYLLVSNKSIVLFPTVSISIAPIEEFSFGAGFTWGVARTEFSSMTEATSGLRGTPQPDDFTGDVKATVDGVDGFVPGFVFGVLASPHDHFDIAAWYRFSDSARMNADLFSQANYYGDGGAVDTAAADDPANQTDVEDAGRIEIAIPMEAKIGFRYRHPLRSASHQDWVTDKDGKITDPMASELFDVELDVTWAHNSQFENFDLFFAPDPSVDKSSEFPNGIDINGTPGKAPRDGSIPHNWKDVLGVRLGADYNVIPDFLALRMGGFFESRAADAEYLHLDFQPGMRGGIGGGLTVRAGWESGAIDISGSYQHTFYETLDNGGAGAIKAISGDLTTDNRSRQSVNGGSVKSNLNEIALGMTARF